MNQLLPKTMNSKPDSVELVIGLHDGHIEGYRRVGDSLFVQVQRWNGTSVEIAFTEARQVIDLAANEHELQGLFRAQNIEDVERARGALIACDWTEDDLASLQAYVFVSLDGYVVLRIVARDVHILGAARESS